MTLAIHGGTPVRRKAFPAWPQYDDAERQGLLRALDQGEWWRAAGSEVTAFEREFAGHHGAPAAIAVTTGTHALELALELVGIGPGDEVVIPAYTFIATSNAVVRLGAVPVPVDVDPETYCLDPAALDAVRGPRTRALMPVHMAGHVVDMDAIGAWARRHGVVLIQDAAHAHGARWDGRRLGELDTLACFSFQNGKLMTAGEGGAVLLPDAALYEEAFVRHSCGRPIGDRKYVHRTPSSNFRLSEFSGAVLRAQLGRLERLTTVREERFGQLGAAVAGIDGIRLQGRDPRCERDPHYMVMLTLDDPAMPRDLIVDALIAEGIPAFINYPPVYRTEAYRTGPVTRTADVDELARRCPVSEELGRQGLWLHHKVLLGDPADVEDVASALDKVLTAVPARQPVTVQ